MFRPALRSLVTRSACKGAVAASSAPLLFSTRYVKTAVDQAAIVSEVSKSGLFAPAAVESATKRLIEGLAATNYTERFSLKDIAAHVNGLLAAEARQRLGESPEFAHESKDFAFYICKNDEKGRQNAVRRLATFVSGDNLRPTEGSSTRSYLTSDGSIAVYTAVYEPFVNPNPAEGECNIDVVGTKGYLETVQPDQRERAQDLLNRQRKSQFPVMNCVQLEGGTISFAMASSLDRTNNIASLLSVLNQIGPDVSVLQSSSTTFSNGVHVYRATVKGATRLQIEERASLLSMLPNRPYSAITRLHESGKLTCEEAVFIDAAVIFAMYFTPSPENDDFSHLRTMLQHEPNGLHRLYSLRQTLSQEMMSERYTNSVIALYPEFAKLVYEDFSLGTTAERRAQIMRVIEHRLKVDLRPAYDVELFRTFLKFNQAIVKHNFYKVDKAALGFRLDPAFLGELDYPRVPYGLFLLAGAQWRGFHIRFTDIARGGVRMIISKDNTYRKNKRTVFQENYNLALTQLLKNKDIPEGGSKGTILVSSGYLQKFDHNRCEVLFLQYVDALLDLIIPGEPGIVDNLKQEEIIFLGPDENTAGTFPAAGALYSKERGYKQWKSFTTGKDPVLGGIPHDKYGMTTHSVRMNVEGIYNKLGLKEESLTKFQTGGPDGDLGSNEITMSKEKIIGIVDGSASLHDPNGIDRAELNRLVKARLTLRDFDRSKLSKGGFLVLVEDRDVTLPDGTVVDDGARLRDEFHFLPYSNADVFVPCGGRPRSVTLENVGGFLKVPDASGEAMLEGKFENIPKDQLKYKIIVEGANLFISQDARLALERCGVVLIKDASANKGGVTSSSLEVLSGLALSDEEHAKHMSVKPGQPEPEFYKKYVKEIVERVDENARQEFEAIWREWEKNPSQPKTLIADALSSKNVQIRANMLSSDIFKNKDLVRYVMLEYAPKTLLEVVPIDTMLKRVPENYQQAICAMWLASHYVYATGVDSNEFDFFRYMTEILKNVEVMKKSMK